MGGILAWILIGPEMESNILSRVVCSRHMKQQNTEMAVAEKDRGKRDLPEKQSYQAGCRED